MLSWVQNLLLAPACAVNWLPLGPVIQMAPGSNKFQEPSLPDLVCKLSNASLVAEKAWVSFE